MVWNSYFIIHKFSFTYAPPPSSSPEIYDMKLSQLRGMNCIRLYTHLPRFFSKQHIFIFIVLKILKLFYQIIKIAHSIVVEGFSKFVEIALQNLVQLPLHAGIYILEVFQLWWWQLYAIASILQLNNRHLSSMIMNCSSFTSGGIFIVCMFRRADLLDIMHTFLRNHTMSQFCRE